MKTYKPYLLHILKEIEYLQTESAGLTLGKYLKDETHKRAFVRSLEIIGEAVKNLPEPLKTQHPAVPWKKMAGMRDKLIHLYFGVNHELVWMTIRDELPHLRDNIEHILEDIDK